MSDFKLQWEVASQDCQMCANVRELGWWGESGITHCRSCHRTWKMTSKQAHCTVCCEHFSSPSAYDIHLGGEEELWRCKDPGTVVNRKTGEYLLMQKEDGTWVRPSDEAHMERVRAAKS